MMPFGHFTWGGGAWSPDALYATFTLHREPERVAVAQPAMQIGAGSEQWRPEQTHPGRLVDHVVEGGRASGCGSGGETASRSSCAHVAMSRSPPCQRVNGQRRGRARVYRAGSCAMVLLDSTAV